MIKTPARTNRFFMDFFRAEGKYLLAFSGGPDSVYLLYLLKQFFRKRFGTCNDNLALCYINYHDSPFVDQEEEIVKYYADKFSLKLYKIDAYYNKEKDHNFENWAREFRYDRFREIMQRDDFDILLTAHQKTDVAETYIIQKTRGNYPKYYGIREGGKFKNMWVLRPILTVTKNHIIQELQENNILYYDDITNKDEKKQRTAIRANLTDEQIEALIREIYQENERLSELNSRFYRFHGKLSFSKYNRFTKEEQKRYCFFLVDKANVIQGREGLGKRLYDFLKKQDVGTFPISDEFVIYRTKYFFFFSKDKNKIHYSFTYDKPGVYENEFFRINLTDISKFNLKKLPVTIRNYQESDELATDLPTKDVKKALQKQSVPFYLRNCYPVMEVDGKIQCLPFYKDIIQKKIPLKLKFLS